MIPKHYLYLNCLPILVLLHSTLVHSASDTTNMEFFNAVVNITIQDPSTNLLLQRIDGGRYGLDSPKTEVKGVLITPMPNHGVVDRQGCDPQTRFHVPPNTKHWIAFLQRGNCTFKEKILRAASHNASAVVIYNNISKEEHVTMTHAGTGDIVAIIVSESTGRDILSYVERNISVLMAIAVGSRSPPKGFSRGSLVFVSISFIVLMIISSAWLIFYFIQKIRYTSARDRNQRRLGDAAKKAIGKLTTRTVKKGDKETDPDFDHCAVCIESYKHNDIVRVLPCKHVFHKLCVDPWLSEHCTCPMCKLNILKALGIVVVFSFIVILFPQEALAMRQSCPPLNHLLISTMRTKPELASLLSTGLELVLIPIFNFSTFTLITCTALWCALCVSEELGILLKHSTPSILTKRW
uniref:E3 ubiquitin-protein ligase RNF130 n=1 Tax=Leptobrachium leishanense TaxID=445787 RepID=A0A8C5Q4D5_9ANUR